MSLRRRVWAAIRADWAKSALVLLGIVGVALALVIWTNTTVISKIAVAPRTTTTTKTVTKSGAHGRTTTTTKTRTTPQTTTKRANGSDTLVGGVLAGSLVLILAGAFFDRITDIKFPGGEISLKAAEQDIANTDKLAAIKASRAQPTTTVAPQPVVGAPASSGGPAPLPEVISRAADMAKTELLRLRRLAKTDPRTFEQTTDLPPEDVLRLEAGDPLSIEAVGMVLDRALNSAGTESSWFRLNPDVPNPREWLVDRLAHGDTSHLSDEARNILDVLANDNTPPEGVAGVRPEVAHEVLTWLAEMDPRAVFGLFGSSPDMTPPTEPIIYGVGVPATSESG